MISNGWQNWGLDRLNKLLKVLQIIGAGASESILLVTTLLWKVLGPCSQETVLWCYPIFLWTRKIQIQRAVFFFFFSPTWFIAEFGKFAKSQSAFQFPHSNSRAERGKELSGWNKPSSHLSGQSPAVRVKSQVFFVFAVILPRAYLRWG